MYIIESFSAGTSLKFVVCFVSTFSRGCHKQEMQPAAKFYDLARTCASHLLPREKGPSSRSGKCLIRKNSSLVPGSPHF